jgi:hypothetical protein
MVGEEYIKNLKEYLEPLKTRIIVSHCKGQSVLGKEAKCDLIMGEFLPESYYNGLKFSITRVDDYTELKLWTEKVKSVTGRFSPSGETINSFSNFPEVLRDKANELFDYIKQFEV